jgi:hypothetical protein
MKISDHFTMNEVIRSQTAIRNGINNLPTEDILKQVQLVAEKILEPIRIFYDIPFVPSSWYRCFELEEILCAKAIIKFLVKNPGKDKHHYLEKKQHPKGNAVDFEIPGIPNKELAMWMKNNLPDWDQIILEFHNENDPSSGWVHASIKEKDNRKQCLIFDGRSYTTF